MPTIVVDVMPKAELLDPQGKALAGALARTGRAGFTGALFVTHLGAYDNNLASPVQEVDSKTTFDLSLSYQFQGERFASGLSVGIDAVNVLDEEPPFVNIAQSPNGGGGFDPTLNNPVGRIVGLTLRKKW